ncbi:MAG: enoyl-CoA hydratase/isomerase family protein [Gammaproteobacteria bacterium]
MSTFSISTTDPSDYQVVTYSVDGPIATVTLNRPDALNAFNTPMRSELAGALQHAAENSDVRIVLLTGSGRAFSAGADLKDGMPIEDQTVQDQLQVEYLPSLRLINEMNKPVMAVLNGVAAGVGLSYALNCDLAIMSDKAYMMSPFAAISLVPDGGMNWQLVHAMGYKKAYEFGISGQKMTAEMAEQAGLVNKVVPAEVLMESAVNWANALTRQAPLSLAATKRVMRFAMENTWKNSFDLEAAEQVKLLLSPDNVEGINAFLEKRKPVFKG